VRILDGREIADRLNAGFKPFDSFGYTMLWSLRAEGSEPKGREPWLAGYVFCIE
jgi:hypothetical protein